MGRELPELRTARSRTYASLRGGFVQQIAAVPINFRDGQGVWQPIDNALAATAGGGFVNGGNSYRVRFPASLRSPVEIAKGDDWAKAALVGAAAGSPVASGATVTYSDVLPGVSVRYTAENAAVKEDLLLAGRSAGSSFTYAVTVAPGLSLVQSGREALVEDASAQSVFSFAAPSMRDAAGVTSSAISLTVAGAAPNYTVTVVADPAWLSTPGRSWPVSVDPSWFLVEHDSFVESGSPSSNYGAWDALYIGQNGSGNVDRALVSFDLSSLPAGVQVEYAELDLYEFATAWCTCNESIDVHRLTRPFVSSGVTWSSADGSAAWSSAGGDYDPAPLATQTVAPAAGWYRWQISDVVRRWYEGTLANDGLLLKASDEAANTTLAEFRSGNSGTNVPAIYVTYQPRLGLRSLYSYEEFPVTAAIKASVNVGNGNLVVAAADASFNGVSGLDLDLTHSYNSLEANGTDNPAGNVGAHWTFVPECFANYPADNSLSYDDPSGYQVTFAAKRGGGWAAVDGMNATVSLDTAKPGWYWLTFNKTGMALHCYANGLGSVKDKNGNKFVYSLNGNDLLNIDDAARNQQEVSFTYNAADLLGEMTDRTGRSWRYAYDAAGELTSATNPLGETVGYGYGADHLLTSITAADGDTTVVGYDSQRRVVRVQRGLDRAGACPAGSVCPATTFAYPSPVDSRCSGLAGVLGETVVSDPLGHATVYCYDERLRVLKTVDPLDRVETTSWNDNDDPAAQTNAAGGTTDYRYSADGLNNLETVQGPAAPSAPRQTQTYSYPGQGAPNPFYPSAYTDPNGRRWGFKYDSAGNQIERSEGDAPGQNPVTTRYNSDGTTDWIRDAKGNGNPACPDPTVTVCYRYLGDGSHDLASIVYPAPLGSFQLTWDPLHRLKTISDGKGQTTSYDYDALDRLKTIRYSDGSTIAYSYDSDGNLTAETDAGQTTSYSYDNLDQLQVETKPGGATIVYDNDGEGRLAAITENGATTRYGYDNADRLTSIQQPGAAAAIAISYPDQTHTTISYPGGASVASTYDSAGRLVSVTNKNGAGTTVASYAYTYSYGSGATEDGSLRRSVTTLTGTTYYCYDSVGRLLSAAATAACPASGPAYAYSYDANGNITSNTVNGATTSYTVNNVNQISGAGYSYDGNGNMTASPTFSSFTYNNQDQTTAITPAGGSALAGSYLGRGQFERTGFAGDSFLNDLLGIARRTSGSTSTDYTRTPAGTEYSQSVGGTRYYFAFDGLGSVVGLFDSSGGLVSNYVAAYEPYGKLTGSLPAGYPSFNIRFAGYWYDSQTGLYKAGARYYNPGLGRWTQRDPIDNPSALQGWNRYIYAGDDPINFTDPSGACILCTKHVKRTVRRVTRAAHGSLDFLASDRGWNGLRIAASAAACAEGAEVGAVAGPEGAVVGCLAVAIAFDVSAEQARRRINEERG